MSWTPEQFEARGGCHRFPGPYPIEEVPDVEEIEAEIPDCDLEEEDPERFDGQS